MAHDETTGGSTSRSARIDALLDEAIELDGPARERFLESVEEDLREELARLLNADLEPSPVDAGCVGLDEAAAAFSGKTDAYSTIAAGQQIGSYRLLRLLGEGGMASVWLAERVDGQFAHQVAVKCLKTGLATPASRARFLLEQQIMAQLQHPYIARLYDAGVSGDNVPFIVMEWVDGVPLTRFCDDRRLGLTQRLQLFRKVCAAVAHAHQNLIVHRDIKPANILVGSDGEPRLLDFGIAKLLDESAPVTRTGMHMLTPEYAAPEQFDGGPITTATDIFMLGAVLYELLCGLRPQQYSRYRVATEASATAPSDALRRVGATTLGALDSGHPAQIAARRDSAPERLFRILRGDLDTIVLKALQTEPDRRYPTVQAFNEDILRYLRQQPISARKDAAMYRAGKFLQRHAIGVALGVLVVAALLSATAISIYQARRAQIEARHALATKAFLFNLFEVSDSGLPRDQVPTTQTLLQDGAKRVRTEFADAPEVKFDLLLMLGRVQRDLGQSASAEPLLREALAIADARFAPDRPAWLQAHTEWAELLNDHAHLKEAASQLITAIAAHQRAGAADSDALSEALAVLGAIYANLEQFDQAVATSRKALDMAKRLHGERHPEVQKAMGRLGELLMRSGHLDEAEVVGRANVAMSRELYGEHHAKYANSLTVLADVLAQLNKDAEAERLARQALAIEETVYDRPNAALIDTLSALTDSLYNQDKIDDTESTLRKWLDAQSRLSGAEDPAMAPILMNLGLIEERRHRFPQAEQFLRQSLAISARRPDSILHADLADTWRSLADALIEQQRFPEATAATQEALTIDRRAPGGDDRRVGMDQLEFARVQFESGNPQTALERVDVALAILGKSSPLSEPDLNDARLQKAAILDRLAHADQAKALLIPLIPQLRQNGSEYADHDRLSRCLTELGRAQAGTGDPRGALASWEEALTLQQAMQPQDGRAIAALQGLIAQVRNAPPIAK